MAKARAKKKKVETSGKRGRPQLYPLTGRQENSIKSKIEKGISSTQIIEDLGVHPFAVLRVRRALRAGA